MRIKTMVTISALALALTGCAAGSAQASPPISVHAAMQKGIASPFGTAATTPSAEVIAQRMGIKAHAYNATTDPNQMLGRQHGYTSKAAWGPDLYSSIEVFSTVADAHARMSYIQNFTCPIGDGYDYIDGTALLRLACNYTPAQAKALWGKFLVAAR